MKRRAVLPSPRAAPPLPSTGYTTATYTGCLIPHALPFSVMSFGGRAAPREDDEEEEPSSQYG